MLRKISTKEYKINEKIISIFCILSLLVSMFVFSAFAVDTSVSAKEAAASGDAIMSRAGSYYRTNCVCGLYVQPSFVKYSTLCCWC